MTTTTKSTRPSPAPASGVPWLWVAVGLVVVGALIVAILAGTSGSDDSEAADPAAALAQVQPVEVTGDALPSFEATTGDAAIGMAAPEVVGKDFAGRSVEIAPDGTPKLLLFVAHWCPHCQREVPKLVEHLDANPLPGGVELMAVATATREDQPNYPPSAWLDEEGWTAPVLVDDAEGTVATAFGLSAYPYFVAVDGDNQVLVRATGELSTDTFDQIVSDLTATA